MKEEKFSTFFFKVVLAIVLVGRGAVTKCHKLSGLNNKIYSLTGLEARNLR